MKSHRSTTSDQPIRAREIYRQTADRLNLPVTTVGKIGREIFCSLAAEKSQAVAKFLDRYRIPY